MNEAADILHSDGTGFAGGLAEVLAQLFARAPALAVLLRGPDHVIEFANPAYMDLVGDRDLIGRPAAEALPELAEQGFLELLDRVYRSGEPFIGHAAPSEVRRGPHGRIEQRWFDFVYQPIFSSVGAVVGIFGQATDVTGRVLVEQAYRDSEARFTDIFSQLTVGIAQTDLTGRFLLVNDRQCEILGRSREEVLGTRMQALTHPEDLAANTVLFHRMIDTGEPFVIEKRYLRPDGTTVWVRNNVSLVSDGDGRPRYVTAVIVDISQEKHAELELRRSQAIAAGVLDAALDSIVIISGDGQVVEWNRAAERTFGFSRGEALGRPVAELIIPPEQREAHYRGMASYLATGVGPVIGRRVEVEALRRGGDRVPVELAISPVDVEGGTHFAAYLREISARRAAEAALREGEQRLRATYEHAFVGIAEVDAEGRFLRVNEQFSAITGYPREDLLQLGIWDITHPDDRPADLEQFRRQMAGELAIYRMEKRYVGRNGDVVWVELAASVVADAEGRPAYGVRVVRDVTDRHRWAERQRLLMDELNHRVKNTLATVQSIAVQSARTAADPQAGQQAFLDRLLALSRAHDLLTVEQWEGAELGAVVAAALAPFATPSEERFRREGPAVWLDARRALALALALHELATNAAKYGALTALDGRVAVTWTVNEAEAPELVLTWSETGGPPVEPPARRGFGSRLLERGLAQDLQGTVLLDFRPGGLVCTVRTRLPGEEPAHAAG